MIGAGKLSDRPFPGREHGQRWTSTRCGPGDWLLGGG